MSRISTSISCLTLLAVALWMVGCNKATEVTTGPAPDVTDADHDADDHDHADHDHGDDEADDHDHADGDADHDHADHDHADKVDPAKIAAGLALLSDEDRALAEKQKNCPVTGGPLGAMGKPIKLVLNDQTVFICCGGCKEKITADPDKYLAKLNE